VTSSPRRGTQVAASQRVRRRDPLPRERRGRVAVGIAAALWIGAVVLAAVVQHPKGAPHFVSFPPTACPAPAVGVDTSLGYGQGGASTVAAIQKILRPQLVRDSLLWSRIEPVQGERDWSVPDAELELLRAAGIQPLLIVLGSPSWANGVRNSTPDGYLHVPSRGPALAAWLKHYSEFLAAAVRRYHVVVKRWEIWNEPNLSPFWQPRPNPLVYLDVYETLRATILRVDPSAQVAVGGLGDLSFAPRGDLSGLAFLRALTRTRRPLGNVAIHPYATSDHAPGVEIPGDNNFVDIARVHNQLVAAGERASIWVTEWGWSSASIGQVRQAQYVDRALTMLQNRYRFVTVATYFAARDTPPASVQGLLDENLSPKPAAAVFRAHAERLAARCRRSVVRP
jgi:polysaccharide biosynthesis protein PslG